MFRFTIRDVLWLSAWRLKVRPLLSPAAASRAPSRRRRRLRRRFDRPLDWRGSPGRRRLRGEVQVCESYLECRLGARSLAEELHRLHVVGDEWKCRQRLEFLVVSFGLVVRYFGPLAHYAQ